MTLRYRITDSALVIELVQIGDQGDTHLSSVSIPLAELAAALSGERHILGRNPGRSA